MAVGELDFVIRAGRRRRYPSSRGDRDGATLRWPTVSGQGGSRIAFMRCIEAEE